MNFFSRLLNSFIYIYFFLNKEYIILKLPKLEQLIQYPYYYKTTVLKNFIKKEALAQMFSREFCKISKNTFFHRTHLVAASDHIRLSDKKSNLVDKGRKLNVHKTFRRHPVSTGRVLISISSY